MTRADRIPAAMGLVDERLGPIGPFLWIGNEYLKAAETRDGRFEISASPLDPTDWLTTAGTLQGSVPRGDRRLVDIDLLGAAGHPRRYCADRVEAGDTSLVVPWGEPTVLLESPGGVTIDLEPGVPRHTSVRDGFVRVQAASWWIAIAHDGSSELSGQVLRIDARRIAIAFGPDAEVVARQARRGLDAADDVADHSTRAWERYFASCPLVDAAELGPDHDIEPRVFRERQLWHWRAARLSLSVSLGSGRSYFAPDRARWHGTWSSDGPLTMTGLALTSDAERAADALVEYVRSSIDRNGHHSWYVHADGTACLGRLGDSGVMSHGLPDIVRAAEFLDRVRPDLDILDRVGVGGRSVYETLAWYLAVSDDRDLDGDGLWDTANLWESGWDDKVSPLFSSAPVEDWVPVMTSGDPVRMGAFIAEHANPVTSMAEQFNHLMALDAMHSMAERRADPDTAAFALTASRRIRETIAGRQFSEQTGTYRDWDSKTQRMAEADCLDGFYFLAYESDPVRRDMLRDSLRDPRRFGLTRPPSLARDHPRYDPVGYWAGSYWPRESFYLALGLLRAGAKHDAITVLLGALSSGSGLEVLEHLNADTGERLAFHDGATVVTQGMSVGLCLGLLEAARGGTWWPSSPAFEGAQHD